MGEHHDYDPSLTNVLGPYTATFNDYVRGELKFESDLPYEVLNGRVWPWSFGEYENQYLNVAETMRQAMTVNPFLKVYVGNGYYDLATPYFATEYTFNHLGLDPSLRANISGQAEGGPGGVYRRGAGVGEWKKRRVGVWGCGGEDGWAGIVRGTGGLIAAERGGL